MFKCGLFGYKRSSVDSYMGHLKQQLKEKDDQVKNLKLELNKANESMNNLKAEIEVYKKINCTIISNKRETN